MAATGHAPTPNDSPEAETTLYWSVQPLKRRNSLMYWTALDPSMKSTKVRGRSVDSIGTSQKDR